MSVPPPDYYQPPETPIRSQESLYGWSMVSILFRPRATIVRILDEDRDPFAPLLLAMTCPTCLTLLEAYRASSGRRYESLLRLLGDWIGVGSLFWLAVLFLASFLLFCSGKVVGGKARLREVRTSMAWAAIPLGYASVVWLALAGFSGLEMFRADWEMIFLGEPTGTAAILWVSIIVGSVWSLVIMVICLAETQELPIARTLLSLVIGLVTSVAGSIGILELISRCLRRFL